MSHDENRKSAAELDDALRLLDHELEGLKLETPVRVRAIGGYALLKHGVRKGGRAFTVDIDTVTRDYSAAVMRAIETVAERASLAPDWLNNYNVMDNDPEQVEDMIDAEWLPQPLGLRNIAVSIASIETLTRSKISAADTVELSDRGQDAPDLLELLDHQGITGMAEFAKKYPDPFGEYPEAYRLVREHLSPEASRAPTRNASTRFPELAGASLDPYGLGEDLAAEEFDGEYT